jgi:hypothetical protein
MTTPVLQLNGLFPADLQVSRFGAADMAKPSVSS